MSLQRGPVVGRLLVLARPDGKPVCNTVGRGENLAVLLSDRVANGEAFAGERVVSASSSAAGW